ncbi:hypothetical protein PHMEG_00016471 [Phytophthora megakarya]|uniref:Ubiquitin-like protease family profile domain-containing protein n=1 Tax=Phytophthora megakarya TaxID=4795 RepID=A0A225VZ83_9STRA|nr:hypothetical protein PHMEG_00016471 [Phytophthora megakarya]
MNLVIERAWRNNKFTSIKGLMAKVKWRAYKYVTLPVSGNKHCSLMVVEALMTSIIELYHVDSSTKDHDPAYAFKAVKWAILTHIVATSTKPNNLKVNTHRYKTRPQQSNRSDSGVVVVMRCTGLRVSSPTRNPSRSSRIQPSSKRDLSPVRLLTAEPPSSKSSKWETARSKGRSESSETKLLNFLHIVRRVNMHWCRINIY